MPVISISTIGGTGLEERTTRRMRRQYSSSLPNKTESRWPAIDLAVSLTCFPILILLALLIDANIAEGWTTADDDGSAANFQFLLGLIAAFAGISFLVCAYILYRMGVRLWAGPLDASGSTVAAAGRSNDGTINLDSTAAQCQTYEEYVTENYPPSYDSVMAAFGEQPPPSYDETSIVFVQECRRHQIECENNKGAFSLHI